MTLKRLKRINKDLIEQRRHFMNMALEAQEKLNVANKTVHDLIMLNNQSERNLSMTEKALEKECIVVSYLEDRQVRLIQAMA